MAVCHAAAMRRQNTVNTQRDVVEFICATSTKFGWNSNSRDRLFMAVCMRHPWHETPSQSTTTTAVVLLVYIPGRRAPREKRRRPAARGCAGAGRTHRLPAKRTQNAKKRHRQHQRAPLQHQRENSTKTQDESKCSHWHGTPRRCFRSTVWHPRFKLETSTICTSRAVSIGTPSSQANQETAPPKYQERGGMGVL